MTKYTEEIVSPSTKLQKTTEQSSSTGEILSTNEPTEQLISTNEIRNNNINIIIIIIIIKTK